MSTLKIKKLKPEAEIPKRAHSDDSGMDLCACLDAPIKIYPGESVVIPTGVAIGLPFGYEGQIRSRSGLAAKSMVSVANSPGTVDRAYNGELKVILINHGAKTHVVFHGDRIAQLVVAPVYFPVVEEVSELTETDRGAAGFGSTGV